MIIGVSQEPLIIQTRAGNPIPNERGLKTMPQDVIQQENYQKLKFPSGMRLSERKRPTGMYNCHGMTFLSRRGGIYEESAVMLALVDDDYKEVSLNETKAGDVILYYDSGGGLEHSGIVVDIEDAVATGILTLRIPWILSKWGNGGEYVHRYNYCPYNSLNVRWMREGSND